MPQLQIGSDEPQGRARSAPAEEILPVDTRRESREGLIAGVLGLLSVVVTFVALPIGASDVGRQAGGADDRTFLLDVGASGSGQLTAMILRCLGLLLVIAILVFFARAIKARNPRHSPWIAIVGSVAIVVIAACTAYTFFQVRDIGREFVGSGPRTLDRAQALLDTGREEGLRRTVNVIQGLAGLAFGICVSLTSLEGQRVGLLTRFLGIFGIGTGLASAIGIPVAPALFLAWIGSLAFLAVGYWPGGRPPAWDAGRAVSWEEADAAEMTERAARREERRAR